MKKKWKAHFKGLVLVCKVSEENQIKSHCGVSDAGCPVLCLYH